MLKLTLIAALIAAAFPAHAQTSSWLGGAFEPEPLAAWVQAVFSIIAIGATGWFAHKDKQHQARQLKKTEEEALRNARNDFVTLAIAARATVDGFYDAYPGAQNSQATIQIPHVDQIYMLREIYKNLGTVSALNQTDAFLMKIITFKAKFRVFISKHEEYYKTQTNQSTLYTEITAVYNAAKPIADIGIEV